MARPFNPINQYHVSIHNTQGYRYASTQVPTVDPKTGRRRYHHIHWGRVDENNKFFPGNYYMLASIEERQKLIFPADWDLSEINKLSGQRKPGRPVLEGQDENRLYGDIWLLEQIADVTGLRKDLLKTFRGNTEIVDIILTLAIYLFSGKGSYNHLASWQKVVKMPYDSPITSSFITRLTQSITEQNRMDLLRCRAVRLKKNALCAVDSTSRSAWGTSLTDIRYGKNKDHLPLPQTIEAVVYTLDDHMPVYYRSFLGNTPDSRSLETILKDLDSAGMKDVVLITDRGYESIRNLEMYIDRGQPMIMGTKVRQSHVINRIKSFGVFDHHPHEMELYLKERLYYKQYDLDYQIEGRRGNFKKASNLKLNLYFDPLRRSQEIMDVEVAVATQKEALEALQREQRPLDDDVTLKSVYCYYDLDYDESRRILKSFSLNEKKVARREAEAGFFANTTLKIKDSAIEANHHYKLRDEQEKYFAMMKGAMGAGRQRNWSEGGKAGRLFILFVAQILGCCLGNACAVKLEKYDSIAAVLNEMRPIRYIKHKGTQGYMTPFIGKQVEICNALGFDIPEGCAPEYAVKKTNKGKRGRPRKEKLIISDS